jgi:hypothetical protein
MLNSGENPLVDEHHNFEDWCETLFKHYKPDIIDVTMSLFAHDLKNIRKEQGHFITLLASRKLVTKDFRLKVYVYFKGTSKDENSLLSKKMLRLNGNLRVNILQFC